jgi:hypothetical protein
MTVVDEERTRERPQSNDGAGEQEAHHSLGATAGWRQRGAQQRENLHTKRVGAERDDSARLHRARALASKRAAAGNDRI